VRRGGHAGHQGHAGRAAGHVEHRRHAGQQQFREKLIQSLWEIPERAPLDLILEGEIDCGAYLRRRVTYQTEPGLRVPAWLLVPQGLAPGQRAPGVLFLHGHSNFGKDNVARIDTSPERHAELARFKMDADPALAEAGFVVLAPDLREFGERSVDYPGVRRPFAWRPDDHVARRAG